MILIYKQILYERERLEKEIKRLEKSLDKFPDGNLICARNGNGYKWYCSDGHKKIYIPKNDRALAQKLATKKFLSTKVADLTNEKEAFDLYLNKHSKTEQLKNLLKDNPEFSNLLPKNLYSIPEELLKWQCEEYEKNPILIKGRGYKCQSGHRVRSKSEAIIDTILYEYGLPFRYEEVLILGETKIYPDFTIINPNTRKKYYWENFGMMDNPDYARSAASKIQLYITNQIYPTIDLIMTFETKDNPITPAIVADEVRRILLE